MTDDEVRFAELERRLQKLEQEVFGRSQAKARPPVAGQNPLSVEDLKIPRDILFALQERIRKVGYLDLILILLYFSPRSLTYSDMMDLSKELKKQVHYEWLNTHFHRQIYSGLVSSAPIPNSQEKTYSLFEPGRRRAEAVMAKLKAS